MLTNYTEKQQKIKNQIDKNNKALEELVVPFKFTLNNEVAKIMKENEGLRAQCEHQFENGICIWCYTQQKGVK